VAPKLIKLNSAITKKGLYLNNLTSFFNYNITTMEENTNYDINEVPQKSNTLIVDEIDKTNLITAAKWAKILGIFMYVSTAIMGIALLFMFILMLFFNNSELSVIVPLVGGVFGLFFIGILVVYYFLARSLYNFGNYTKQAVSYSSQQAFSIGIKNLSTYFWITGLMLIVCLILYVVMLIFIPIFGTFLPMPDAI
jgi:hypothetical protein